MGHQAITSSARPRPARSAPVNPRKRASAPARAVKRTVLVVLLLLIIMYGVVPQIGNTRRGIDRLSHVNPLYVLLAFGLEVASLISYTLMTRATLPATPHIRLFTLFRIQLSTKAVSNVVPGGSAAGGTLGYRLLTSAGVPGPAAGFTLGTVGLGSAVVLNLMLWIALLISIPFNGFNPIYVTAAIVGAILMALAAGVVALLMRGADRADRVIRAIARRVPFVEEETASRFARQTALRLHDLADEPELIRRSVLWAVANWGLDAAALWVLLFGFGVHMNPVYLLVAYGLINVLAAIPLTPGGLGVVETALAPALVGFGAPTGVATIAVLSWRFFQYLLPIPSGGVAYLSLKLGKLGQEQRASDAREKLDLERRVWDEETGRYRAVLPTDPDVLEGTPGMAALAEENAEATSDDLPEIDDRPSDPDEVHLLDEPVEQLGDDTEAESADDDAHPTGRIA